MWALKTELRSSGLAASTLIHGTISPGPRLRFLGVLQLNYNLNLNPEHTFFLALLSPCDKITKYVPHLYATHPPL